MEFDTMPKDWDRIIELDGVTAQAGDRYAVGLKDATLGLARGDAAIVTVPHAGWTTPLADLCCGLEVPDAGAVRFLDRPWNARGHRQAAEDRGRIGRVWPGCAWVGNLDIDENILLPQLHHTHRSEAALRKEGRALSQAFGLDDLPRTRPAWTPKEVCQKAQWVRALLAKPELLILEFPDDTVDDIDRARLVESVELARTRGAAVLWITSRTAPPLNDRPGAVHEVDLTWQPKENAIHKLIKDDARE
jgi:predicted ABC-type transport system involved in lysophospholipase L1 biosynthesis ATPase subunit